MEVEDKLSLLEESKQFISWHKNNPKSHLAHVFRMFDEANENIWQFGYYNTDDTITTFFLENEDIKEIPEQQIFKKDKHKLDELDIKKVKLSFSDALDEAKKIHATKYSQHPILKMIAILQVIENSQLFNVTFVTETFNTLNIHIDSTTGEIVKENLTSLMEMAKFEKGKKQDYIG